MQRVLVVLLAFAVLAFASDVVELNPDNFDTFVDGSRPAFVEFFAPWCGHCKNLAPEYEIVATAFKSKKSNVLVAKVDCDQHRDLCSRFDVSGYPTLKWFQTLDDIQPYSGGRTAEDIIKFINSKTGLKARVPGATPSYVVDLNENNFDSVVLKSKNNVFVKFYAPWCGHCKKLEPAYEQFSRVFVNEPDVTVARVDCDAHGDVCARFDVSGYPTLKWFAAGNKKEPAEYDGGRTIEGLVSYVNDAANTHRNIDGTLTEDSGLIAEFSDLVKSFTTSDDKNSLVDEAKKIAAKVGTKMAKVYERAFQKASEDVDYIANEIARLQRMIEGGSLSPQKIDEFTIRKNILKQFS